ncbi:TonB-dependent receptor domain-containing protein [Novosphingobium sp. TH158]|uniref:TonB-dependent receptor domain-containing protein n=1 Tax=Novosphingobium sp. TH158 TaxID=2067455 RepID=UPI0013040B74|nr:TonB-dependent receptor [Novosphingobium sp. TH158]
MIRSALMAATMLSFSGTALAQDADEDSGTEKSKEIVVTGTLIRGVAPGGSQTIAVGAEQIQATGAANTSDLLASVPAAGNFLSFVGVRGSSNFSLAVNRPSLRYLGNTSGSTATTLLLLNGHRLPGMGINQTTADLDAIAAGAIERVEIVTDGGSSTYGSDAVGGVINFITRKEFDGVEAKGSYGLGNYGGYQQANAAITVGKKWDGVSAFVSYDFAWHNELYGADLPFSQNRDWINNAPAELACTVGSIQNAGNTYALPGLAKGLGNRCDNTELQTAYPRETKHSVYASLSIDHGGPVSFMVTGFYVNRKNVSDAGPLLATGTSVPATSPFYIPITGVTGAEVFQYNFSPVFGNHTYQTTKLESWGFTPSAKISLGSNWQLNVLANYGRGRSDFIGQQINPTPINTAAAAGTFNPANLTAATNTATLAAAADWYQFGKATNELMNFRAVMDGTLLSLPAGEVKLAVGGELMWESYKGSQSRTTTFAGIATSPLLKKTRDVRAVFGELSIPLLGEDMGVFHSLVLTASGRYDDYSDFGDTFNPKLGLTFEPVDWIKLRGTWGKAFQAPGLSDLAQAAAPTINVLPLSVRPFVKPGLTPGTTDRNILYVIGGTKLPLSPQTAKTWSAGFDVKPPVIPGLSFGMTYYNINYEGSISIYPIFDPNYYTNFPDQVVTYDQGIAAIQARVNELNALVDPAVATARLASLPLGLQSIYAVMDGRSTNLGSIKTAGFDFYVREQLDTSFGNVYLDASGTYITKFLTQSYKGGPVTDSRLTNFTKLRLATTLGANIGNLKAQVTWQHSQGYKTVPTAANLNQQSVDSFNVFNLFMNYAFKGDGALKDASISLNVDNLLNQAPPLFRGAGNSVYGFANGWTLGRVVKLGVSKKF